MAFLPLRILHAIRSVDPRSGGPMEGVKQISAVNGLHGHHIEVLSLDSPDDQWVKECPLPVHAMGPAWFNYGYSRRMVPWLKANRQHYDVVIINGIWQYNAFGVWRALHGTTTPYFVFPHGMLDPWFKQTYPLKHLKKWLYWPWADYRVLRDAKAVLFTCEEERRLARQSFRLYNVKEQVLSYGTAGPSGDEQAQRALLFQRYPHLHDKRCLLFLGRVHVKKGPDILFRAFSELLRATDAALTKNLHIIMAGPNEHAYGQEMAALVHELGLDDRVTWLGMVTGDMKWGSFYAADVFVLPSHQENFGIAVAEALACGLPVLISTQVNIWREVEMDKAGLVDSDDIAGTVRMLSKWLALPQDVRSEMRTNARRCFSERFYIKKTALSLIQAVGLKEVQEE